MYSLLPGFVALYFLGIGIVVLLQNKTRYLPKIFFIFCVVTFFWQFTWAILFQIEDVDVAESLAKLGYFFILFLPTTLYHFLVILSKRKTDLKFVNTSYILSTLLVFFLLFTDYLVEGVFNYTWGYYPKAGPLHPLHVLQTVTVVLRGTYVAYIARHGITHQVRIQSNYCIAGMAIYSFASIDYLCNYGFSFYPPGIIFITIGLTIIGYTIIKHRLIDLSIAISNLLGWMLSVIPFLFVYFLAFLIFQSWMPTVTNSTIASVTAGYIFLVCLLYPKILPKVQQLPHQFIAKKPYDLLEVSESFSVDAQTVIDHKGLFLLIEKTIKETLNVDQTVLFVDSYKYKAFLKFDPQIEMLNNRQEMLNQYPDVVMLVDKGKHFAFVQDQKNISLHCPEGNEVDLVISCVFQDELLGVLMIYKTEHKKRYGSNDFRLFEFLSVQVGELLYRINLHNELIHAAEERNKFLKAIAGGIGHELRSPLVSISYSADMAQETIEDDGIDNERLSSAITNTKTHLDLAFSTIDIMLNNISHQKISTAGFVTLDAKDCIEDGLALYPFKDDHRVRVKSHVQQNFKFLGSPVLFRYILFNLLKNALYYVATKSDLNVVITAQASEEQNLIMVRDTGPGIPGAQLNSLFEDFMSSNKQGGTGLGLSFCKRAMEAFGGAISCESVLGAYTEFKLVFPHHETEETH